MAIPAILAVLVLHLAPTIAGGFYAFTNWDGITKAHWTGFANFRELFGDPAASAALWQTLRLTLGFVVLGNGIALVLALGLNRTLKSRYFLRALFFAPVVVSPVAIGFLWQYIFQSTGPLNEILGSIGLRSLEHAWIGETSTALWCVLALLIWQVTGLLMIIYLAGLASIPDEYYEAAAVDGAGIARQFRAITVPFLLPAITVNTTLTLLIGLRVFDQVIALTGGGPANSTQTLATQIYVQAFQLGRFGYSTTVAFMLTILVVAFTLAQGLVMRIRRSS
jgi:raffinose/stachyose/melibiose transport system permease protein